MSVVAVLATVGSLDTPVAATTGTRTHRPVAAGAQHARNTRRTAVEAAPAVPPGAKRIAALPRSSSLRVDVVLKPADPVGLATYALGVSTPGSPDFRHYLTTAAFVSRFGPNPSAIATVQGALRSRGIAPGRLSANHLAISVRASAARLEKAFSTGFARYRLRSGRVAYANTDPPQLPADAAAQVQDIVGLDSLVQAQSGAVHVPHSKNATANAAPVAPQVQTGGPQPCATAGSGAVVPAYTADQIAAAYGFSALYGQGDLGQGQTVALIEGEPDLASDIAAYQSCYGTSASVSYVSVDGGAGAGPGSGEAALDIEQIIGLAPDTHIVVYQSYPYLTNLYDEFVQAVSSDTARVISTSWGDCEALATAHPDVTEDYEPMIAATFDAENTLFEEAAVQGQSVVAASGDSGSEGCDPDQDAYAGYSSELAVQDPSAQPFVTGVGGTTLSDPQAPSSETVWNSVGAGGGGISDLWSMPSYQSAAPASVGVVNADSSGGPCGSAGYCREVPDVSADADPYTGYAIYWNGQWWAFGGTSAGAPLWSALLSLTDASPACASGPVGFADPALYAAAADDPGAFNDVTVGDNDYSGANHGTYPALPGYDMASGLGTPTANLPAALCSVASPSPLRVTSASSTLLALGVPDSFTVSTTGSPVPALTESGSLPGGLAFTDEGNGTATLAGSPTQSGVFPLVLTAANGTSTATQDFTLVIGGPPAFSSPTTATFSAGVKGSFQVTVSGTPTPAVTLVTGTLPPGLALSSTGRLAGTPSTTSSGTYPLALQASNGVTPSATETLTVIVDGAPTFTSPSTASFAVGARAAFTVATSAVPTATLTESGAFVPGLAFAPAGNGTATIVGTPTMAGAFAVTLTATNAEGTTTQTLTVDVAPAVRAPAITSAASATFAVASYSTFQLSATGSPAPTFSIVSGAVPMGSGATPGAYVPSVTLSTTGLLSGWPDWFTGGIYHFVVEASNSISPAAFQDFTLTVDEAPEMLPVVGDGTFLGETPATASGGEFTGDVALGVPAHLVVRASGFPIPSLRETGSLPAGTAFTDNGDGTATISGTPTQAGTFSVYVTMANVDGGVNSLIALSVAPAVAPSFVTPADQTVSKCADVIATGFPLPTLTSQSATQPGWSVVINEDYYVWDPETAAVCNVDSSAPAQVAFTATNSAGQATQTLNVDVSSGELPGSPPFTGPTAAVFPAGTYSAVYLGSTSECAYEATSGQTFPAGLSVTPYGLISGVPGLGTGGTYRVNIECTEWIDNHLHNFGTETFILTVTGPSPPPPLPPPPAVTAPQSQPPPSFGNTVTISTPSLPLAVVGVTYRATLSAMSAGENPALSPKYRWTLVGGTLPSGLKLGRTNGLIAGRPRRGTSGTFTFTVEAEGTFTLTKTGRIKVSGEGTLSITVAPGSVGAPDHGLTGGRVRHR